MVALSQAYQTDSVWLLYCRGEERRRKKKLNKTKHSWKHSVFDTNVTLFACLLLRFMYSYSVSTTVFSYAFKSVLFIFTFQLKYFVACEEYFMRLTFFQVFVSLTAAHSYSIWESKAAHKKKTPRDVIMEMLPISRRYRMLAFCHLNIWPRVASKPFNTRLWM